jgi:hypothetical protein
MVVRCGANSAANCFNIRAGIWWNTKKDSSGVAPLRSDGLLVDDTKEMIRKFTEIHILTIQSGVNKRNKNRGEHSVIKHQFSIHSYIPVIKKYHGNQM